MKSWDKELAEMNKRKRGSPFEFPESLIKLQAIWHQWIDYRGVEGVTRKLTKHRIVPKYNDFSTINRRVNKLDVEIELPKQGSVGVVCDGSGMRIHNGGVYRQRMYGKKRTRKRYIKVVISVDPVKKKLLACDASLEGGGMSEPGTAELHIKNLIDKGISIEKFWGDGAFDAVFLYDLLDDLLDELRIESAIKPRWEKTSDHPFSANRKNAVEVFKEKGYRKWADEKKYGLRWSVEGVFSAVKRKFGETLRSMKTGNMILEAKRKFWAYELMNDYAAA